MIDDKSNKSKKRKRVEKVAMDDTAEHDPLDVLAAEYSERCRLGERVSVEEYTHRYPKIADEIRELFPTIKMMEELNAKWIRDSAQQTTPTKIGDYRVIGEIARGGMGIVYEAEQMSLGRRVAVKVLPQHALRRPRDVRRFQREAETAAQLHHSNIVPVFGVGQDGDHHYIVMQLIRGVGLDEIIAETKQLLAGTPNRDSVVSGRSSTVKQSAISLLHSELRRDTIANCDTETLVSDSSGNVNRQMERATQIPVPSLLQIEASTGGEYCRNVARIGQQAAEALQYAHSHDTLHRDVKPGNLLLDAEGCVWMADFGLAKAIESEEVTNSGDVVGTLAYVAPERFQGETTERSDIYSLGLTLHEMLTLRRAFTGNDRVTVMNQVTNERLQTPRKLNPNIPKDLETIVMKAAAHDPADRYESAGELARDLDGFLNDRPIKARRLSKFEHAVRWCRRHRSVAALAGTVLFLMVAVFAVTVTAYLHADKQRRQSDATTNLAVGALDEFYSLFAAGDLNVPISTGADSPDGAPANVPLPLSQDVAVMLDRMLPVYDEFAKRANDSSFVDLKAISAIGRLGDIRRRLGQTSLAKSIYGDALRRISALKEDQRNQLGVRVEAAKIHNGMGLAIQQENWYSAKATQQHQLAISLLERDNPSPAEKFELARSLYLHHISRTLADRRDQTGLDRAKEILGELEKQDATSESVQFLLAKCLLAYRSGCGSNGKLNERQARAIDILKTLVAKSPAIPDYQFELGDTYRSIEFREWSRHQKTKRSKEQLQNSVIRLKQALEVIAGLDVRHPDILRYNISKKGLYHLLAIALQEQGKRHDAATYYANAIAKQEHIVRQSDKPELQELSLRDLELAYGKLLRDMGKNQQAQVLLDSTASHLERLAQHPTLQSNERHRHHVEKTLSKTYLAWSVVEKNLGHDDRQKVLFRKAEATGCN